MTTGARSAIVDSELVIAIVCTVSGSSGIHVALGPRSSRVQYYCSLAVYTLRRSCRLLASMCVLSYDMMFAELCLFSVVCFGTNSVAPLCALCTVCVCYVCVSMH
jgi:hypothetical protein